VSFKLSQSNFKVVVVQLEFIDVSAFNFALCHFCKLDSLVILDQIPDLPFLLNFEKNLG